MHEAARQFVASQIGRPFASVIEIGSRDINGTIRDLFGETDYTGLDLYEGPLVDWVGDARDYEPEAPVEAVICCEVLEHAARWREIVATAAGWLAPGGMLLITCAGPGRRPHSAIDGRHRLLDGEHYGNLSAAELRAELEKAGLTVHVCRERGEDTQAVALR